MRLETPASKALSFLAALLLLAGCPPGHPGGTGDGGGQVIGDTHSGQYHLGPVEWTGSFWNACGPYPSSVESLEGQLLTGLSNEVGASGNFCDACVKISTGTGKEIILRAITYGVANAAGDLDTSSAAFNQIHQGEYPRAMTWTFVTCPDNGPVVIQYQTQANVDWTLLWVRNPRVPIQKVEVKSARHSNFFTLQRGTDGTFTDNGGFGSGPFTLRITGVNGGVLDQDFSGFSAGAVVNGTGNIP